MHLEPTDISYRTAARFQHGRKLGQEIFAVEQQAVSTAMPYFGLICDGHSDSEIIQARSKDATVVSVDNAGVRPEKLRIPKGRCERLEKPVSERPLLRPGARQSRRTACFVRRPPSDAEGWG